MLTYSIQKTKAPVVIAPPPPPTPPNLVQQVKDNILNFVKGQPINGKWEKLRYSQWVENIRKTWEVGTLCTLRSTPLIINRVPYTVFLIEAIQEIHYMAEVDPVYQEPRAIVTRIYGSTGYTHHAPTALRKLFPEELELVRLRDTQGSDTDPKATTAAAAAIIDATVIDASTGELVSTGSS